MFRIPGGLPMKQTKRSPIKQTPLAHAGESTERARGNVFLDRTLPAFMLAIFTGLFATFEALRGVGVAMSPWHNVVIFGAVCVISITLMLRTKKELVTYSQGADGERIVGEHLEILIAGGYRVIHDVQADGFNVDHVVIGPAGVFAIETKTYSKPAGNPKVRYDGAALHVDGVTLTNDPIGQVKGCARHIKELLGAATGDSRIYVKPVLVFPGWFVEENYNADVWVLSHKQFKRWLDRSVRNGVVLSPQQVNRYAHLLQEHCRARRAAVAAAQR